MRDEFDDDYDVADGGSQIGWRARFMARLSVWVGAALAVAIIVGGAIWTYRLTQRNISAVPVIHAALTPAKVQPDDPGGAVTAHQDITSYGAGTDPAKPPQITFAPPPERPAGEDVAMGVLQESAAGGQVPAAPAEPAPATAAAPGEGTALAPAASPAAPLRPGNLGQQMAAAQKAATEEARLAASAAASAVQIQLGAYESRDETETEWERIFDANEDVLSGRTLVVQSTISGGRRFFRLRAGPFKDRIEAQNVCRALQARGQDCLVAVNG